MTNEEQIKKTDDAIAELVVNKYNLQKAYNYYNGVRDNSQFKYLEDMYGISTPTKLTFTPLIKKHIDALIGEYLTVPIIPKIQCKDSKTVSNIMREKQLKIHDELFATLSNKIQNVLLAAIQNTKIDDKQITQELQDIRDTVDKNFISDYEIAAQNVLDYIMQSRDTDITTVRRDLMFDLLLTGYAYYKVVPTPENTGIRIEVLNPLNTFIDRNIESPYVKNSYRSVVRHWMSKDQIINKYGKDISKEDITKIKENWSSLYKNNRMYLKLSYSKDGTPLSDGILAGTNAVPGFPYDRSIYAELLPIYEVEWTETDENYKLHRYSTVRICDEIYICNEEDMNVIRSQSNPKYCGISVNGISFLNRGQEPYSLVLACADLQD